MQGLEFFFAIKFSSFTSIQLPKKYDIWQPLKKIKGKKSIQLNTHNYYGQLLRTTKINTSGRHRVSDNVLFGQKFFGPRTKQKKHRPETG